MFIKIYDRRINLNIITDYKPIEKDHVFSNKKSYYIKFAFLNNTEEEICFFDKKNERDNFLKILDENLLLIKE